METLSLKDHRLHDTLKLKSRRTSGHRTDRLPPTPETSRSSLEAHDSEDMSDPQQSDSGKNATSRPLADEQLRGLKGNAESSDGQFQRKAPESPPYDSLDDHRPSLPPLKMVLGDKMSSPPHTPRASSLHLQPREPTYTTATYKPPSLYPNKKQKLEPLQPVPPFTSATFVSPRPNMLDSQDRPRYSANINFHPSESQHVEPATRPQSMQRPERISRASTSPRSCHAPPPPKNFRITPIHPPQPHHRPQYQVSERAPMSTFRRPSSSAHDTHPSRPPHDHPDHSLAHPNDRAYVSSTMPAFPRRDDHVEFGRTERDTIHAPSEFTRAHYQNERPPDDLSAVPFEYFYTKARKRSNLPKHSTEIMRAWFDQNIANPYPSEDQKALFATATGISLTQVSNWFINHRRRCPELRDKRVERRKP